MKKNTLKRFHTVIENDKYFKWNYFSGKIHLKLQTLTLLESFKEINIYANILHFFVNFYSVKVVAS